ncbi:MAG: hypothetical protein CSA86_03170 [Arcobacter sp.]|nr:MAG: hypothetical protein CSA86_03170 [Arcobacter sp.]
MIKKVVLYAFLLGVLNASDVQVVPLSNKVINYKSRIYSQDVRLVQVSELYKCKEYIDMVKLKQNKYFAKHYISKNKPLCAKDVYIPVIKKVNFRFGNLEIEKEAEVIRETKSYIKIKNVDGTIEKIYTDGRKN